MSDYVWVVEEGQYSDYRVVGVFSSEANAQAMADAMNTPKSELDDYTRATVARRTLDPGIESLRQGYTLFLVIMLEDGTVEDCRPVTIGVDNIDGFVVMWRRQEAPRWRGRTDKPDVVQTQIWARDETHAIKITNEHRIRLIATGEWAGEGVHHANH